MSWQLDDHTDSIERCVSEGLRELEGYVSERALEVQSALEEAETLLSTALEREAAPAACFGAIEHALDAVANAYRAADELA